MPRESLFESLQDYIGQNRLRFESTVDGLNDVCKVLGYSEQRYAQGSPLEEFLRDNMGAQEALIEWIEEQNLPQWREAVDNELPDPDEDEEEDEDEDGDDGDDGDDLIDTPTETEIGG